MLNICFLGEHTMYYSLKTKKSIRKKIRDAKISLQIETLYFNV